MLTKIGKWLVKIFVEEARKDFGKRGWSHKDPMGGPPIERSFKFRIRGASTLEITSSFYGMEELATGDIPERRMVWLTQEAKEKSPSRFELTDAERKLRMKKTGRISKGGRLPLVVPLQDKNGTVIFRMAPLTFTDAWVHPGIAKFTFMQRAIRRGKIACLDVLKEEAVQAFKVGDPTR